MLGLGICIGVLLAYLAEAIDNRKSKFRLNGNRKEKKSKEPDAEETELETEETEPETEETEPETETEIELLGTINIYSNYIAVNEKHTIIKYEFSDLNEVIKDIKRIVKMYK